MSQRFYHPGPFTSGEVILEGSEAHHLVQVMRASLGDRVTLFNGDGNAYLAEIQTIGKREVGLQILEQTSPLRELGFTLHIGCSLPKGDRADFLIEKLTELGVTDFTPLEGSRSVVHARSGKVQKLERLVIEACKQCERNVLMRVHEPERFADWVRRDSLPATRLLAHPGGKRLSVDQSQSSGVAVAVGPEGGFCEDEIALAQDQGWELIELGQRILRIETAALAVAACLGILIGHSSR